MVGRKFGWDAPFFSFVVALLLLSLHHCGLVASQKTNASLWLTLSGNAPMIIARGGFSGLFPDSSLLAYNFVQVASSASTTLWCDVQLTKDGIGICLPDIKLDNCTNIAVIYPNGNKVYLVNGVPTKGWFSVDYNMQDLSSKVALVQRIYSRTYRFDGMYPIITPEVVVSQFRPPALWLNIQHDIFYRQQNLSMRSYVLSLSKRIIVGYISSPEVAFLSGVSARFRGSKTKLVFRFLGKDITEPSTNQTYGSLLKNLTFIKTFASGILVPKNYIWPVTPDLYVQPYTSVVMDAHKEGLEIFASDFVNDVTVPYNYSYDPLAECLSFIDNGMFSVDGVVADFPITPSMAIGCFSHIGKKSSNQEKPLVISRYGASGTYPDCTDLAYEQAVADHADFIDCPVQVTQDKIPICMSSINLMDVTTVATSPFRSRTSVIPDIQGGPGIFTFNLTWKEIQNLTPVISSPEISYNLVRNPRFKNAGKYMMLSDFLAFARNRTLAGVLISIEHAVFLAENIGYSVTDAVIGALNDSGYNNQTTQTVMIQSTNSSVLMKFKQQTKYKLVYDIDESIRDADPSSIADMKEFAHIVAIDKQSIYPASLKFITGQTGIVKKLHSAGLSVFVYVLQNEFVSQPWDFFSDPNVEINTYVQGAEVDGIITEFPRTSGTYKRNKCSKLGNNQPNYFLPVQAGSLMQILEPGAMPPALAPMPVLDASDVVEPPLPPAQLKPSTPSIPTGGPPTSPPSSGPRCTAASMLLSLAMFFGAILV